MKKKCQVISFLVIPLIKLQMPKKPLGEFEDESDGNYYEGYKRKKNENRNFVKENNFQKKRKNKIRIKCQIQCIPNMTFTITIMRILRRIIAILTNLLTM